MHFSFATRAETRWLKAGHEVAWEQFAASSRRLLPPAPSEKAKVVPAAEAVRLAGDGMRLESDGRELIRRGPELNLFRATTDNDGIRGWSGQEQKPMGLWLAAGLDSLEEISREVDEVADGVTVRAEYRGKADGTVRFERTLRPVGPGLIRCDLIVDVPETFPTLARVGVILETMPGFEQLEWFGRGPEENHVDRKAGYPVGRYQSSVADQYVPYIMPQENGNKCEVRWFELSDGDVRLRFVADPLFEFSTHHFRPEDLVACRHTTDLEDRLRKETVVSIDLVQRGVGTGSCGPQTLEKYWVSPGRYEWGFWIEARRV